MKRLFYILALLGCIISFAACTGPVIIDEEEEDNTYDGDEYRIIR